ncbi:uncharacterized protein L969DRAFT_93716 [Mixia osmundae IAM 14324]|uniref:DASH complex subunit SPC19 n=1 Tax=Mixia osmundae (strain CBS 9802 / IAM 14324 / JCM 22182 / KY 12970) TaxID=764103 RepID=G7E9D5_MIXOS|nr:uncharacterized protein L969DRAFT_93716 [Mixia osmundae IAM 14324]KEI39884.1 hypothetical protein L969DRAFT_93716 [Mixia osmundae IAM 14324]GAA99254.1 hypothetical protein E5Q_05948 [Mixia osmundae IAM 14324]
MDGRKSMASTTFATGLEVPLDSCAQSLHASCQLLHAAMVSMHAATYDVPRLQRILHNTKCYDLVTGTQVRDAQDALSDEIGPQLDELMGKAAQGLVKLQTREETLVQRAQAQRAKEEQAAREAEQDPRHELVARLAKLEEQRDALQLELAQASA